VSFETKRELKRQIALQGQIIKTLEEQVLIMGDVVKIKDLTLQALIGAVGAKVPVEEVKKVLGDPDEDTGLYL
jgi:hypothetical protein